MLCGVLMYESVKATFGARQKSTYLPPQPTDQPLIKLIELSLSALGPALRYETEADQRLDRREERRRASVWAGRTALDAPHWH